MVVGTVVSVKCEAFVVCGKPLSKVCALLSDRRLLDQVAGPCFLCPKKLDVFVVSALACLCIVWECCVFVISTFSNVCRRILVGSGGRPAAESPK